jgi:hypothetical protein
MNIVTGRVALVFVGLAASSLIAGCNSGGSGGSDSAEGKATVTCGDGTVVEAKTPAEQESACASHGGVQASLLAPPPGTPNR